MWTYRGYLGKRNVVRFGREQPLLMKTPAGRVPPSLSQNDRLGSTSDFPHPADGPGEFGCSDSSELPASFSPQGEMTQVSAITLGRERDVQAKPSLCFFGKLRSASIPQAFRAASCPLFPAALGTSLPASLTRRLPVSVFRLHSFFSRLAPSPFCPFWTPSPYLQPEKRAVLSPFSPLRRTAASPPEKFPRPRLPLIGAARLPPLNSPT